MADAIVDKHVTFVEALAKRKCSGDEFGYGITTAEPYVSAMLQMEDAGCKTGRTVAPEALLKEASGRLCAAFPEMVAEECCRLEKFGSVASAEDIGLGDVEAPPNTLMVVRHVLTSDRQDRDGDVLRTAGAKLDPKAPLLWQHQSFLPIGKVLRTVEQTSEKLTVISALLDLNEITADAAKLIEADALRFSHGFRVLDYTELEAKDGGEPVGFDVTSYEILEASLVSVPSNVDAEIELFSRGKLESDYMKAHAKYLKSKQPVRVPGADLTLGPEEATTTLDVKESKAETQPVACPEPIATDEAVDTELNEADTEDKAAVADKPAAEQLIADMKDGVCGAELADGEFRTTVEGLKYRVVKGCPDVKAGRILSARNVEILNEVLADLAELAAMEMARGAEALCDRCIKRLSEIIDSATPINEADDKSADIELTDVVNFVLGATTTDLSRVKHTMDLVFNLEAYNAAGEEYRKLEQLAN